MTKSEENEPHGVWKMICRVCGKRWVAVAPLTVDEDSMECPNCHQMTGEPAMSEHTPGPWTQWVDHPDVYAGKIKVNEPGRISGFTAKIADCESDDLDPEVCEANARLVAASPDLSKLVIDGEEVEWCSACRAEAGKFCCSDAHAHHYRRVRLVNAGKADEVLRKVLGEA